MRPKDLKRFAHFLSRHITEQFEGMADRQTALDSAHLEYACLVDTEWEISEVCPDELGREMELANIYHDTELDFLIA